LEQGLEQGMEQGMERGSAAEKRQIAHNLIGLLDDNVIAEQVGLPLAAVKALRRSSDGTP